MRTSPIIVALDFDAITTAMHLIDKLEPSQCRLKIGKEMFTRFGPSFVKDLISRGFDIFLDLKFHDIPNTVARACQAAADLGVWMINVHALGGRKMLESASKVMEHYDKTRLIAVTLLTSLDQTDLPEIGLNGSLGSNAIRLAKLSQDCGLDGVVCSAHEAHAFREALAKDFLLVTPGIRLANASTDDQKRIMTPGKALKAGANYLVIGRPITQANDPLLSLKKIRMDMNKASMQ